MEGKPDSSVSALSLCHNPDQPVHTHRYKKMSLTNKLAIVVSLAATVPASAVVTAVEDANIPIPADFNGVYLDLVSPAAPENPEQSGSADNTVGAYTVEFGIPSGDWDLNFFFGGVGIAHNNTANPYRADGSDNLSAIHALGLGEIVNGSTPLGSGAAVPLTTPELGGSGTSSSGGSGVSTSGNHIGTNPEQFQPGVESYLGFVLDDPSDSNDTVLYGWVSVTFQDNGSPGTIHDFVLSDEPITIGAIPEPSTSLLLLTSLCFLRRKR